MRLAKVVAVVAAVITAVIVGLAALTSPSAPRDPSTPDRNATSWTDEHGRVCTLVDPPGDALALDCDYPPRAAR